MKQSNLEKAQDLLSSLLPMVAAIDNLHKSNVKKLLGDFTKKATLDPEVKKSLGLALRFVESLDAAQGPTKDILADIAGD